MKNATWATCLICGDKFKTVPARIKLGKAKFCSKKCYTINQRQNKIFLKCIICGNRFSPRVQQINRGQGKYCSRKCSSIDHSGDKHPSWKGGITDSYLRVRNCIKYKIWTQEVFRRDKFRCQKCGDSSGHNLNAHHIIRFKVLFENAKKYLPLYDIFTSCQLYDPLWDISNGITLCSRCHKEEHKNGDNKRKSESCKE